ncbi:hypothetical protein CH35J_011793 [Colletotrichum higginsianum]|uniref:Uncharacterized protein n=1 Tax=Colletotrichum higginsianum TaxID=80884 RepID=A0A4T0VF89_9PEZI|nr:hypothetical protein CH35J_011793 [Colletotrichum higginsianum]
MALFFLAEMVILMAFHFYLLFYTGLTPFSPVPTLPDLATLETSLPAIAFILGLLVWALVLDPDNRQVVNGPLRIFTIGLACFLSLRLAQWVPWCMLRVLQWSPVLALALVAWGVYRKWTGAGERAGGRWGRMEEVGPFRVDAFFVGAGPVMVREVWNRW